jgi:hypothetical protein
MQNSRKSNFSESIFIEKAFGILSKAFFIAFAENNIL